MCFVGATRWVARSSLARQAFRATHRVAPTSHRSLTVQRLRYRVNRRIDLDEALRINDSTGFGLSLAVFSKNRANYDELRSKARVGLADLSSH